jgi:hypothetical protein
MGPPGSGIQPLIPLAKMALRYAAEPVTISAGRAIQ